MTFQRSDVVYERKKKKKSLMMWQLEYLWWRCLPRLHPFQALETRPQIQDQLRILGGDFVLSKLYPLAISNGSEVGLLVNKLGSCPEVAVVLTLLSVPLLTSFIFFSTILSEASNFFILIT